MCDRGSVRQRSGFTLVELLITVAILIILAASTVVVASQFYTSSQLLESADRLTQTIHTAKVRSVGGVNDVSHGVYVETSQYTLYQGGSYESRDSSYDRVIELDNGLLLSNTISGNDITFSRGLGYSSTTGTITIAHQETGDEETITIQSIGIIRE